MKKKAFLLCMLVCAFEVLSPNLFAQSSSTQTMLKEWETTISGGSPDGTYFFPGCTNDQRIFFEMKVNGYWMSITDAVGNKVSQETQLLYTADVIGPPTEVLCTADEILVLIYKQDGTHLYRVNKKTFSVTNQKVLSMSGVTSCVLEGDVLVMGGGIYHGMYLAPAMGRYNLSNGQENSSTLEDAIWLERAVCKVIPHTEGYFITEVMDVPLSTRITFLSFLDKNFKRIWVDTINHFTSSSIPFATTDGVSVLYEDEYSQPELFHLFTFNKEGFVDKVTCPKDLGVRNIFRGGRGSTSDKVINHQDHVTVVTHDQSNNHILICFNKKTMDTLWTYRWKLPNVDSSPDLLVRNSQGSYTLFSGIGDVGITRFSTVPSAPLLEAILEDSFTAALSWTEPATGGSPITGYILQSRKHGEIVWQEEEVSSTSILFPVDTGTHYEFRVLATNVLGEGFVSAIAEINAPKPQGNPDGILDASLDELFVLYPNPTSGRFIIETEFSGSIKIFSMEGKRILSQEITFGRNEITLNTPGVYLYHLISADGFSSGKIVVR